MAQDTALGKCKHKAVFPTEPKGPKTDPSKEKRKSCSAISKMEILAFANTLNNFIHNNNVV
jgi:hypothetical protein